MLKAADKYRRGVSAVPPRLPLSASERPMKSLWIRERFLVLCALTALLTASAFAGVQLVDGLRANAANCDAPTCVPPVGTNTTPTVAATPVRRQSVAPPKAIHQPRRRLVVAPAKTPATLAPVPAITEPTTCAGVVASISWPPRWRVQCGGARAGLLGTTQPAGVTDLFVRADESMSTLRVVALHEAGHAWDFARLDPPRIAQWCAARGCDANHFFSGAVSSQGWAEPSGAEDWASAWDTCHGGEYHRSYMGLAAPLPSQCALQNTLVDFPR